jgi:hypothetical protein
MKKYLLSFCTVWMAAMTIAAAQPSRCGMRRAGSHTINFSGGMAIGGGDIDMLFGPFGYVEYARNVKGRFWAGGRLGVRYDCQSATCQPSYVPENYLRPALYGIGYWEFPVAGRWLSFRAGAGAGVGMHCGSGVKDLGAAPYVMVRAEWVVHLGRHFGVTFSPLLFGPLGSSQVEWTPLAPTTTTGRRGHLVSFDFYGHIGLYARF